MNARKEFDDSTVVQRYRAQGGKCALCGKQLVWENRDKGEKGAWHAHHIDGDASKITYENCACVCVNGPNDCHLRCHKGDFAGSAVVPRDELPHITGARAARLVMRRGRFNSAGS